jgi:hypothetical protein
VRALPARLTRPAFVAPGIAVVAAVGFAVPSVHRIDPVLQSNAYQAHLTDGLITAVARAGGRGVLNACGTPYTGRFQVPAVAYQLHRHTSEVKLDPQTPGVVLRAKNSSHARPQPALDALGGEAGVQTLAIAGGWRIVRRCR